MLPRALALDHALRAWVVGHRIGALDGVMWTLSLVGRGGLVWIGIAVVLIALRRLDRLAALPLVAALLLAMLVTDHLIKPIVGRPRPFVSTPQVAVIGDPPGGSSFPSGHAANAFAGACVLSLVAAEPVVLWWALAFAIAYSRVYLGVHYPLDVTAGAIIGAGAGAITVAVYRRWWRQRARPPSS